MGACSPAAIAKTHLAEYCKLSPSPTMSYVSSRSMVALSTLVSGSIRLDAFAKAGSPLREGTRIIG